MKVVIVGSGRVGSSLAQSLAEEGHDVSIVDEREEAFARLGEDFPGQLVEGVALDLGVLEKAGINGADAFVAATNGDNTNLVVSQIAKDMYGIGCVIARVYDPRRAEFFRSLGIRTVSPTADTITLLGDAVRTCERPRAQS